MIRFIAKRIVGLLVILYCVVTITFFLVRLMPGGPFDRERKLPEHIEKQLLAKYKLDGPLFEQYVNYLGDLLHGDLRLSTKYRSRSVNEILADSLPVSGMLGGIAFCVATIGGVFLGSLAAAKQQTWVDRSAMLAALFAVSLPSFVIGPLLVLVFAIDWPILPVGGWGTWQSLILPSITLAAPYTAYIARLTRSSMLEVLTQDYIRTARAKGLSDTAVIYKHGLRVAILPVVSFLGPLAANLLTGSIVVESIFSIPGTGGFFVNSVLNRDGFLLAGVVIVYCALLVLFNLVVDLLYGLLDHRISLYD
ncbi:MAG: oligopeptide transport system permease protein [Verrucomicrobiota bacterium]|jgi:ABC-type dipeptide/oligopeptide/nickel transport system permease component|nr:oligopeptide transport system permease protein [Verrucomicrobiota bacterium]